MSSSQSSLLLAFGKTREEQEVAMASRHNDCKIPAQNIKKRMPLVEHNLSKNRSTSRKPVEIIKKEAVSTSRLPVPIKRIIRGDELTKFKGKTKKFDRLNS